MKKLSDRSQKMVFIGYEEGTKGYRLLDPVSKTLHVSRDVGRFGMGLDKHFSSEPA